MRTTEAHQEWVERHSYQFPDRRNKFQQTTHLVGAAVEEGPLFVGEADGDDLIRCQKAQPRGELH